jgi:hypothetical protein
LDGKLRRSPGNQTHIFSAASAAFANGFSIASLVAATVAGLAGLLAFVLLRKGEAELIELAKPNATFIAVAK